MPAIHHATRAFVARHGLTIIEAPKGFRLATADGTLSEDTFETAGEITETLRADGVEGISWEKKAGPKGARSGVMAIGFHRAYSNNPHGPGSNDDLDIVLRDETREVVDGEVQDTMDAAKLKAIVSACGLWRQDWETLNPGMRRMNASNRMRGWLRNNDGELTIGTVTGRFGIARAEKKTKTKKGA